MKNTYYKHPRETWSKKECLQRSKKINVDGMGTVGGPRGLINHSSSSYPSYGQKVRYNGGCIIKGTWYEGEEIPLPKIPKTFHFVHYPSWGTAIEKMPK
jgi:hypothetical protein